MSSCDIRSGFQFSVTDNQKVAGGGGGAESNAFCFFVLWKSELAKVATLLFILFSFT